VNDASVTAALNVEGARGQIRWTNFGAQAPGASSLVSVPITSLTNVRLSEATAMTSTLIEGIGVGLSATSFTFEIVITRLVTVAVQSATLQRCENRLHWLDAGQPWPKRGVHCEAGDDDDDDQD
jgi:hypothetical protein